MTDSAGVVFVVDDDASMHESLKNLIRSVGAASCQPTAG
jgi:FixJ family two-component response regulator